MSKSLGTLGAIFFGFVCALVLFKPDSAAADEIWKCGYTEMRAHFGDHDLKLAGLGPFFLRIKTANIEIVVLNAVRMSYSISENTPSKLIGNAHFDLEKGATSDAEITLDKRTRRIRETINFIVNHRNHLNTGKCSKLSISQLPSDVSAASK